MFLFPVLTLNLLIMIAPTVKATSITNINPSSGPVGTLVTLTGTIDTQGGAYEIVWSQYYPYPSIDTQGGSHEIALYQYNPDLTLKTGNAAANSYTVTDTFLVPSVEGSAEGTVYYVILRDIQTHYISAIEFNVTLSMITNRTVSEFNVIPDPIGVGQWTWLNFTISPSPPGMEVYHNIYQEITTPDGTKYTRGPFTTEPGIGTCIQWNEGTYTPFNVGWHSVRVYCTDPEIINGDTYTAFSSSTVDFLVIPDQVDYPWPFVNFEYYPDSPCVGQDVFFDASETYDQDGGTIESYRWYSYYVDVVTNRTTRMGGITPTTTTSPEVVLSFSDTGTFLVFCLATDNEGYRQSVYRYIVARPPVYHDLTINVEGSGNLNLPLGISTFFEYDIVQLTATPDENWLFEYWELDGYNVGQDLDYQVTMGIDHTLTAVFTEHTVYDLTIVTVGSGNTNPEPGTYEADPGYNLVVEADPVDGWTLDLDARWS